MKRYFVAVALLAAVVIGCAPRIPGGGQPGSAPAPGLAERSGPPQGGEGGELPPVSERRIVRTGNISLVVEDVVSARDRVAALAGSLGGYVVSSSFVGGEGDVSGVISIRVPGENFDRAVAELRAMALRVASESSTSKDITEEYIDLRSRLRNAEATEAQYVSLLQRATDVESTLKVYERLKQIRQEIEQIKGRIQFLEQSSATSVITIQLNSAATARPVVRSGWDIAEELKSAVRGLIVAGQIIGTIAIWLAIFSPIWATPFAVIHWRSKRAKVKASKQGPDSTDKTTVGD
ncbi:MAG: DUF4349 domain-containing protein [Chloroflexi bacterium]|nr:DUF4349 domain-containing protein [Chloroflexota bacterium]